MKISNSKKELARIISENGGWRDGEFAAQDKDGDVFKFDSKPVMGASREVWMPTGNGTYKLCSCATIKGWHQTILSREEYFHLYPATDADDGWILWNGVECPVAGLSVVDVKYFNVEGFVTGIALDFVWGPKTNIVYYRKARSESEQAAQEPKQVPVPESKQTIEQLAADYRNRKDYADRKQQEADAAKADAEDKLAELVAAGKAHGLVLSVEREGGAVTPIHPPLIAGDWRQWEVGDFVSWSILGHIGDFKIIAVHHDASRSIGDFEIEDSLGGVYRAYGNECKFIRRP